jgi:hypothetical protein
MLALGPMQPALINSAVFQCIEYAGGHNEAAAEFIACLRADDAWSASGVDMVEFLAIPIVNEPLVFQLISQLPPLHPGWDEAEYPPATHGQ